MNICDVPNKEFETVASRKWRATRKHRKIIKKKSANITWANKKFKREVENHQKQQNRNSGAKEYNEY